MKAYSTRYKFSQHFDFPAEEAYRWCTSYDPGDLSLMGEKGRRDVRRISENVLLLTDRTRQGEGYTTKRKIVLLYPERLAWTSTHVSGPAKHSQFLYEIVPEGRAASRLEFTGFQVTYGDKELSSSENASYAERLRKEDSGAWRLLAQAMERDLKRRK